MRYRKTTRRRVTRRRARRTVRRRRNPIAGTLALAGNPRRRRHIGRVRRIGRRRQNPSMMGGVKGFLKGINLVDVAVTTAGFAGNLVALRAMPEQIKKPGWKYISLVGLPLAARFILRGKMGAQLFAGGLVAAGVHAVNDFILKGQLLPAELAYSPASGMSGLFGYGDQVNGLGAGEETSVDELERALMQGSDGMGETYGFGAYQVDGLGAEETFRA